MFLKGGKNVNKEMKVGAAPLCPSAQGVRGPDEQAEVGGGALGSGPPIGGLKTQKSERGGGQRVAANLRLEG